MTMHYVIIVSSIAACKFSVQESLSAESDTLQENIPSIQQLLIAVGAMLV
jgi:hypothetical protein